MSYLQSHEPRIRTIYGTAGYNAVTADYPDIPSSEHNWFYDNNFDFTNYKNTTLVITDTSGVEHYVTIINIYGPDSTVVQLDIPADTWPYGDGPLTWRIPGAFRPARPSDVGRPCLCPEGLQFKAQ